MSANHPESEVSPPINVAISEESLHSLLDSAADAVAQFDRDFRHVYVNQATANATGRRVSDFVGKTMRELGHTEAVSELIESNLKAVFATGETRTFDVDFSGPAGRALYQCRMSPEFDDKGEVSFAIVISRNLTEERRAQREQLRLQELAAANKLANELAHQLNNPLQGLRNTVFLLQQGATARQGELLREADELLTRMTSLLDALLSLQGEPLRSVEDLTRKVEGVRNLYEVARLVVAVAESSNYAMISVDLNGEVTSWNRAACELYGYKTEEAIGKSLASITAPGREAEVEAVLEKIKDGEMVEPYEAVRSTQAGQLVRVRVYISPVYDLRRRLVGASSIIVRLAEASEPAGS